jgi:hypothetical protein
MNKKVFKYISPLLFFLFVCIDFSDAQPPPPGGTGPPCWPPPCIPIDGGITLLLAAGAIYGSKKAIDFQKENESSKSNN